MNCLKRLQRFFASVVVVTFFVTNTLTPAPMAQAANVESPSFISSFKIPAEFGKVTDIIPAAHAGDIRHATYDDRLLIHIQEAHANYDAQNNIKKILEHLSQNYGIKLVLLEGAGNKLRPELFNFFPEDKELNQSITDSLMKAGELTGAEVFLIDQKPYGERSTEYGENHNKNAVRLSPSEGYGVEDAKAYRECREAYRTVYNGKKITRDFLDTFYLQWRKEGDQKLNKSLREFLARETDFQEDRLPLQDWMAFSKTTAIRELKVDLDDVREQKDWPVLVRYFRLRALGGKIDASKVEAEKAMFLRDIAAYRVRSTEYGEKREGDAVRRAPSASPKSNLADEVKEMFAQAKKGSLPIYKTRFVFERLLDQLPKDFSFDAYPNLRLAIQQMILLSEIQSEELQGELKALAGKITANLSKTEQDQKFVETLRHYRLLKKLFGLELGREEYRELQSQKITPEKIVAGLEHRPSDLSPITMLFDAATRFYELAITREDAMMQNVQKILAGKKDKKAVLITGGFHTEGFKEKILASGSSYVGITPNIGEIRAEDEKNYIRSLFGATGQGPRATEKPQGPWTVDGGSGLEKVSQLGSVPSSDLSFIRTLPDGAALLASRRAEIRDIGRQTIASVRSEKRMSLTRQFEEKLRKVFDRADLAGKRSETREKVWTFDDGYTYVRLGAHTLKFRTAGELASELQLAGEPARLSDTADAVRVFDANGMPLLLDPNNLSGIRRWAEAKGVKIKESKRISATEGFRENSWAIGHLVALGLLILTIFSLAATVGTSLLRFKELGVTGLLISMGGLVGILIHVYGRDAEKARAKFRADTYQALEIAPSRGTDAGRQPNRLTGKRAETRSNPADASAVPSIGGSYRAELRDVNEAYVRGRDMWEEAVDSTKEKYQAAWTLLSQLMEDFQWENPDAMATDVKKILAKPEGYADGIYTFLTQTMKWQDRELVLKKDRSNLSYLSSYTDALGILFREGQEAPRARIFIEKITDAFLAADPDIPKKVGLTLRSHGDQPVTDVENRSYYHRWNDWAVAAWPKSYLYRSSNKAEPLYHPADTTLPWETAVPRWSDVSKQEQMKIIVQRMRDWALWIQQQPQVEKDLLEFAAEVQNLLPQLTMIELDSDLPAILNDYKNFVVRPVAAGRSRLVFYLPKLFLESFDMTKEQDIRELTVSCLMMLEWSHREGRRKKLGATQTLSKIPGNNKTLPTALTQEGLVASLATGNRYRLTTSSLIRKRLFRIMRDSIIRETVYTIPRVVNLHVETLQEEARVRHAHEDLFDPNSEKREWRDEVTRVYEGYRQLVRYYFLLGKEELTPFLRAKRLQLLRTRQRLEGGILPVSLQWALTVSLAREINFSEDSTQYERSKKEFLDNLDMVLLKKAYPRNATLDTEEDELLKSQLSFERMFASNNRETFRDKLIKIFQAQAFFVKGDSRGTSRIRELELEVHERISAFNPGASEAGPATISINRRTSVGTEWAGAVQTFLEENPELQDPETEERFEAQQTSQDGWVVALKGERADSVAWTNLPKDVELFRRQAFLQFTRGKATLWIGFLPKQWVRKHAPPFARAQNALVVFGTPDFDAKKPVYFGNIYFMGGSGKKSKLFRITDPHNFVLAESFGVSEAWNRQEDDSISQTARYTIDLSALLRSLQKDLPQVAFFLNTPRSELRGVLASTLAEAEKGLEQKIGHLALAYPEDQKAYGHIWPKLAERFGQNFVQALSSDDSRKLLDLIALYRDEIVRKVDYSSLTPTNLALLALSVGGVIAGKWTSGDDHFFSQSLLYTGALGVVIMIAVMYSKFEREKEASDPELRMIDQVENLVLKATRAESRSKAVEDASAGDLEQLAIDLRHVKRQHPEIEEFAIAAKGVSQWAGPSGEETDGDAVTAEDAAEPIGEEDMGIPVAAGMLGMTSGVLSFEEILRQEILSFVPEIRRLGHTLLSLQPRKVRTLVKHTERDGFVPLISTAVEVSMERSLKKFLRSNHLVLHWEADLLNSQMNTLRAIGHILPKILQHWPRLPGGYYATRVVLPLGGVYVLVESQAGGSFLHQPITSISLVSPQTFLREHGEFSVNSFQWLDLETSLAVSYAFWQTLLSRSELRASVPGEPSAQPPVKIRDIKTWGQAFQVVRWIAAQPDITPHLNLIRQLSLYLRETKKELKLNTTRDYDQYPEDLADNARDAVLPLLRKTPESLRRSVKELALALPYAFLDATLNSRSTLWGIAEDLDDRTLRTKFARDLREILHGSTFSYEVLLLVRAYIRFLETGKSDSREVRLLIQEKDQEIQKRLSPFFPAEKDKLWKDEAFLEQQNDSVKTAAKIYRDLKELEMALEVLFESATRPDIFSLWLKEGFVQRSPRLQEALQEIVASFHEAPFLRVTKLIEARGAVTRMLQETQDPSDIYSLYHLDRSLGQMMSLSMGTFFESPSGETSWRLEDALTLIVALSRELFDSGFITRYTAQWSDLLDDPELNYGQLRDVLRVIEKETQAEFSKWIKMYHEAGQGLYGDEHKRLDRAVALLRKDKFATTTAMALLEKVKKRVDHEAVQNERAKVRSQSTHSDAGWLFNNITNIDDYADPKYSWLQHERRVFGGKGSYLMRMHSLGLPVPSGFIIPAALWSASDSSPASKTSIQEGIRRHLRALEKNWSRKKGHPVRYGQAPGNFENPEFEPLFLSVRSGSVFIMPGISETSVAVGFTPEIYQYVLRTKGEQAGRRAFMSFMESMGVSLGIPREEFEKIIKAHFADQQDFAWSKIDVSTLSEILGDMENLLKTHHVFDEFNRLYHDSEAQLFWLIQSTFESWNTRKAQRYRKEKGISNDWGTPVIVQAYVFGDQDERSGSGIALSRDRKTGQLAFNGEWAPGAEGMMHMQGRVNPESLEALRRTDPQSYETLRQGVMKLDGYFGVPQMVEFTVEGGQPWFLQTVYDRRVGHNEMLPPLDGEALSRIPVAGRGSVAYGNSGGLRGVVVFRSSEILRGDIVEKAANYDAIILVSTFPTSDDSPAVINANRVLRPSGERLVMLTQRGGLTSHAAVVANYEGIPTVVDVQGLGQVSEQGAVLGGQPLREGDVLTVDFGTGAIYVGAVPSGTGPRAELRNELILSAQHRTEFKDAKLIQPNHPKGISYQGTTYYPFGRLVPKNTKTPERTVGAVDFIPESAAVLDEEKALALLLDPRPGTRAIVVKDYAQMTYLTGYLIMKLMEMAQTEHAYSLATGGTTESARKLLGLFDLMEQVMGGFVQVDKVNLVSTLDNYIWRPFKNEKDVQTHQISSYRNEQLYMMLRNLHTSWTEEELQRKFLTPPELRNDGIEQLEQLYRAEMSLFMDASHRILWQLHGIGTSGHDAFNEPQLKAFFALSRDIKNDWRKLLNVPENLRRVRQPVKLLRPDYATRISEITQVQNIGHFLEQGFHKFFLRFMGDHRLANIDDLLNKLSTMSMEGIATFYPEAAFRFTSQTEFLRELQFLLDHFQRTPAWAMTMGTGDILRRTFNPDSVNLFMVSDPHKAAALAASLEQLPGESENQATGAWMHLAPNAIVIATRNAATRIDLSNVFFFEPQNPNAGLITADTVDKAWSQTPEGRRIDALLHENHQARSEARFKKTLRMDLPIGIIREAAVEDKILHISAIYYPERYGEKVSVRFYPYLGSHFTYAQLRGNEVYLKSGEAFELVHQFEAFPKPQRIRIKLVSLAQKNGETMEAVFEITRTQPRSEARIHGNTSTKDNLPHRYQKQLEVIQAASDAQKVYSLGGQAFLWILRDLYEQLTEGRKLHPYLAPYLIRSEHSGEKERDTATVVKLVRAISRIVNWSYPEAGYETVLQEFDKDIEILNTSLNRISQENLSFVSEPRSVDVEAYIRQMRNLIQSFSTLKRLLREAMWSRLLELQPSPTFPAFPFEGEPVISSLIGIKQAGNTSEAFSKRLGAFFMCRYSPYFQFEKYLRQQFREEVFRSRWPDVTVERQETDGRNAGEWLVLAMKPQPVSSAPQMAGVRRALIRLRRELPAPNQEHPEISIQYRIELSFGGNQPWELEHREPLQIDRNTPLQLGETLKTQVEAIRQEIVEAVEGARLTTQHRDSPETLNTGDLLQYLDIHGRSASLARAQALRFLETVEAKVLTPLAQEDRLAQSQSAKTVRNVQRNIRNLLQGLKELLSAQDSTEEERREAADLLEARETGGQTESLLVEKVESILRLKKAFKAICFYDPILAGMNQRFRGPDAFELVSWLEIAAQVERKATAVSQTIGRSRTQGLIQDQVMNFSSLSKNTYQTEQSILELGLSIDLLKKLWAKVASGEIQDPSGQIQDGIAYAIVVLKTHEKEQTFRDKRRRSRIPVVFYSTHPGRVDKYKAQAEALGFNVSPFSNYDHGFWQTAPDAELPPLLILWGQQEHDSSDVQSALRRYDGHPQLIQAGLNPARIYVLKAYQKDVQADQRVLEGVFNESNQAKHHNGLVLEETLSSRPELRAGNTDADQSQSGKFANTAREAWLALWQDHIYKRYDFLVANKEDKTLKDRRRLQQLLAGWVKMINEKDPEHVDDWLKIHFPLAVKILPHDQFIEFFSFFFAPEKFQSGNPLPETIHALRFLDQSSMDALRLSNEVDRYEAFQDPGLRNQALVESRLRVLGLLSERERMLKGTAEAMGTLVPGSFLDTAPGVAALARQRSRANTKTVVVVEDTSAEAGKPVRFGVRKVSTTVLQTRRSLAAKDTTIRGEDTDGEITVSDRARNAAAIARDLDARGFANDQDERSELRSKGMSEAETRRQLESLAGDPHKSAEARRAAKYFLDKPLVSGGRRGPQRLERALDLLREEGLGRAELRTSQPVVTERFFQGSILAGAIAAGAESVSGLWDVARAEVREATEAAWVQASTPRLAEHHVYSRQWECGLPMDLLEKIAQLHNAFLAGEISQATLTGGLGALMPDLFEAWAAIGMNVTGIHPLWNFIKNAPLKGKDPEGARKLLGQIAKQFMEETSIRFDVQLDVLGVSKMISFRVYKTQSKIHKAPQYYLDGYTKAPDGKESPAFLEVYDDRGKREIDMAFYSAASERLIQILEKNPNPDKIILLDHEVFVSLPTRYLKKAKRVTLNHTVFRPGLFEAWEGYYELLNFPEWLRSTIVHDGKISIADFTAEVFHLISGVNLVEHLPALLKNIFRAAWHRVLGFYDPEKKIRSTNGVFLPRWQSPKRRALIERYKAKLQVKKPGYGLPAEANDRRLFEEVEWQGEDREQFKVKNEWIAAGDGTRLLIWLRDARSFQDRYDWLGNTFREYQAQHQMDVSTFTAHLTAMQELIEKAVREDLPEDWQTLEKDFGQARDLILGDPIVANVRRQVPYKGPDKYEEILRETALKAVAEAAEAMREEIMAGEGNEDVKKSKADEAVARAGLNPVFGGEFNRAFNPLFQFWKEYKGGRNQEHARFATEFEGLRERLKDQPTINELRETICRVLIGGRTFDEREAHERFLYIRFMSELLGLEDRIATLEDYTYYEAQIIFSGTQGGVMLSDEDLEASATSMMKDMSNGGEVVGPFAGSNPEIWTIWDRESNKRVEVLDAKGNPRVSQDQLREKLRQGKWEILNGIFVAYSDNERSSQEGGGRRPSARSLLGALKEVKTLRSDPQTRRERMYQSVAASWKVDMVTGQAMAHAYLLENMLKEVEDREAMFAKLRFEASDYAVPAEAPDFTWEGISGFRKHSAPGMGLFGMFKSFRELKTWQQSTPRRPNGDPATRGIEALNSIRHHVYGDGRPANGGDIFEYLKKNVLDQLSSGLQPFKAKIEQLAEAAKTADDATLIRLNLEAMDLTEMLLVRMAGDWFERYMKATPEEAARLRQEIVQGIGPTYQPWAVYIARYLDGHPNARQLGTRDHAILSFLFKSEKGEAFQINLNVSAPVKHEETPTFRGYKARTHVFIDPAAFSELVGGDADVQNVQISEPKMGQVYKIHPKTDMSTEIGIGIPMPFGIEVLKWTPVPLPEIVRIVGKIGEYDRTAMSSLKQLIRQAAADYQPGEGEAVSDHFFEQLEALSRYDQKTAVFLFKQNIKPLMTIIGLFRPDLLKTEHIPYWWSPKFYKDLLGALDVLESLFGDKLFDPQGHHYYVFDASHQGSLVLARKDPISGNVFFASIILGADKAEYGTDGKVATTIQNGLDQFIEPGVRYAVKNLVTGESYGVRDDLLQGWTHRVRVADNGPRVQFLLLEKQSPSRAELRSASGLLTVPVHPKTWVQLENHAAEELLLKRLLSEQPEQSAEVLSADLETLIQHPSEAGRVKVEARGNKILLEGQDLLGMVNAVVVVTTTGVLMVVTDGQNSPKAQAYFRKVRSVSAESFFLAQPKPGKVVARSELRARNDKESPVRVGSEAQTIDAQAIAREGTLTPGTVFLNGTRISPELQEQVTKVLQVASGEDPAKVSNILEALSLPGTTVRSVYQQKVSEGKAAGALARIPDIGNTINLQSSVLYVETGNYVREKMFGRVTFGVDATAVLGAVALLGWMGYEIYQEKVHDLSLPDHFFWILFGGIFVTVTPSFAARLAKFIIGVRREYISQPVKGKSGVPANQPVAPAALTAEEQVPANDEAATGQPSEAAVSVPLPVTPAAPVIAKPSTVQKTAIQSELDVFLDAMENVEAAYKTHMGSLSGEVRDGQYKKVLADFFVKWVDNIAKFQGVLSATPIDSRLFAAEKAWLVKYRNEISGKIRQPKTGERPILPELKIAIEALDKILDKMESLAAIPVVPAVAAPVVAKHRPGEVPTTLLRTTGVGEITATGTAKITKRSGTTARPTTPALTVKPAPVPVRLPAEEPKEAEVLDVEAMLSVFEQKLLPFSQYATLRGILDPQSKLSPQEITQFPEEFSRILAIRSSDELTHGILLSAVERLEILRDRFMVPGKYPAANPSKMANITEVINLLVSVNNYFVGRFDGLRHQRAIAYVRSYAVSHIPELLKKAGKAEVGSVDVGVKFLSAHFHAAMLESVELLLSMNEPPALDFLVTSRESQGQVLLSFADEEKPVFMTVKLIPPEHIVQAAAEEARAVPRAEVRAEGSKPVRSTASSASPGVRRGSLTTPTGTEILTSSKGPDAAFLQKLKKLKTLILLGSLGIFVYSSGLLMVWLHHSKGKAFPIGSTLTAVVSLGLCVAVFTLGDIVIEEIQHYRETKRVERTRRTKNERQAKLAAEMARRVAGTGRDIRPPSKRSETRTQAAELAQALKTVAATLKVLENRNDPGAVYDLFNTPAIREILSLTGTEKNAVWSQVADPATGGVSTTGFQTPEEWFYFFLGNQHPSPLIHLMSLSRDEFISYVKKAMRAFELFRDIKKVNREVAVKTGFSVELPFAPTAERLSEILSTLERMSISPRAEVRFQETIEHGTTNAANNLSQNATYDIRTLGQLLQKNAELGGGTVQGFRGVTEKITDGIISLTAHMFNAVELAISLLPAPLAQKASNVLMKARFSVARKMLGVKVVQSGDAFILGREFALGQGFLAATRAVLGDAPVAVIVRDAKDRAFVDQFNAGLAPDKRIIVASEEDLAGARAALRKQVKTEKMNLKALLYTGETLKNQLADIMIQRVTPRMFQNFLKIAGVSQVVERMRAEYLATAQSA